MTFFWTTSTTDLLRAIAEAYPTVWTIAPEDRDPTERVELEEDDIEPLATPSPDDIPTEETLA